MKAFLPIFLLTAVLPLPSAAGTEYYKMVGKTIAFPYYYEGIQPVLHPGDESHFAVTYNENRQLLSITHQKNGKQSNSDDGWAQMAMIYDGEGRIREVRFLDEKGHFVINQDLGFAREIREYTSGKETVSTFYNGKGWKVPNPIFP